MAQLLWTQKQDVGPSARSNAAMVFDRARKRVVLFGGAGAGTNEVFNDTWEWDGENWTQYEDIGPAPRSRHAMAYDDKRKCVILFGGSAGNQQLKDMARASQWCKCRFRCGTRVPGSRRGTTRRRRSSS